MSTPNHFVSLTKRQRDELCQIAGVTREKRDQFIRGVENSVASYFLAGRLLFAGAAGDTKNTAGVAGGK